jgi:hypothetical protein
MKMRYTWYKRRSETRFFIARIVVSRLIALGWIIAVCACFYAGFAFIADMDNSGNAENHFGKAAWSALFVIVAAGINHLLMAGFGALIEMADNRMGPPRA